MLWDIVFLVTGLDAGKFNKGLYVAALTALLFYVLTFIVQYIPVLNGLTFSYPTTWFIAALMLASMRAFGMSDSYLINGINGRYEQ